MPVRRKVYLITPHKVKLREEFLPAPMSGRRLIGFGVSSNLGDSSTLRDLVLAELLWFDRK